MEWTVIEIDIEPQSKLRHRIDRRGRSYTPKRTVNYENAIRRELILHRLPMVEDNVPIAVRLLFTLEKPKRCKRKQPVVRPDLSNLSKAVEDAANGVLWYDDDQIVSLEARKQYGLAGKVQIAYARLAEQFTNLT